jgi:hypothetical protein
MQLARHICPTGCIVRPFRFASRLETVTAGARCSLISKAPFRIPAETAPKSHPHKSCGTLRIDSGTLKRVSRLDSNESGWSYLFIVGVLGVVPATAAAGAGLHGGWLRPHKKRSRPAGALGCHWLLGANERASTERVWRAALWSGLGLRRCHGDAQPAHSSGPAANTLPL